MKRIYITTILLISVLYSFFIFSNPVRINFWIFIMWAPALVAMTINYIRYKSAKKMFEPITKKIKFKSIVFAISYPIIFLGVLAVLLNLAGIVIISEIELPKLNIVQIIMAPFANFLLMYGEEYGWRGFLLEEFSKNKGKIKSTIIVGCVWAAFHFPVVYGLANYYGIENPFMFCTVQMLAVFILSFPFAHVYYISRNIIAPIILHFTWNLLNPILFGNVYLNNPGIFKGDLILINGEGIAGIILGSVFVIWFLYHYKKKMSVST